MHAGGRLPWARPLGVDGHFRLVHSARAGRLLLRQLKNIALAKRKIDVYRAESPRDFEPDRATLSVVNYEFMIFHFSCYDRLAI